MWPESMPAQAKLQAGVLPQRQRLSHYPIQTHYPTSQASESVTQQKLPHRLTAIAEEGVPTLQHLNYAPPQYSTAAEQVSFSVVAFTCLHSCM